MTSNISNSFPSVPADIAYIYQPKDMNNITHEEVIKFLDCIKKSNCWFMENMQNNIQANDLILEDMHKLSDDIQSSYERFKRRNKATFHVGEGIDLVINSVAAVLVAAKTKAIVAVVFFKPAAERVRDSITVTNVFIWMSGVLVGVLACELMKRARLF